MKQYAQPEIKILAFLQTEQNCLNYTQSGGDTDGETWDDLAGGEF